MSKILVNNNGFDVGITDTGVTVPAGTAYTIPPQNYLVFAASSDVIIALSNGTLVLNDGSYDITNISNAVDIIKGWAPASIPSSSTPFFFDYSGIVSGDAPVTLISYTVPDLTNLFLSHLLIACRIEAMIQVTKNGEVIGDLRTGASKPLSSFDWSPNRECVAGDIVEVVLTKRVGTSDVSVGAHLMGATTT